MLSVGAVSAISHLAIKLKHDYTLAYQHLRLFTDS